MSLYDLCFPAGVACGEQMGKNGQRRYNQTDVISPLRPFIVGSMLHCGFTEPVIRSFRSNSCRSTSLVRTLRPFTVKCAGHEMRMENRK